MSDWPGAQDIAEELKALMNPGQGGLPPEVQEMIEAGKAQIDQLTQENGQLKAAQTEKTAEIALNQRKIEIDGIKVQVEAKKAETAQFEAETDRMKTEVEVARAHQMRNAGLPI